MIHVRHPRQKVMDDQKDLFFGLSPQEHCLPNTPGTNGLRRRWFAGIF
jgi:hypothetical protein